MMSNRSGDDTYRRRQLWWAFVWLGGWWVLTLSLGWTILGESFAARMDPLASFTFLLF